MDYAILAAGRGSRLGSLGSYLQKCMYPVLDAPLLEYQLRALLGSRRFDAAADRVVLVVGRFQEQVRAYFGDSFLGLPLRYAVQEEPLGTAHAVGLAVEALGRSESLVVLQGDSWTGADELARLAEHPLPDVLSAFRHKCGREHPERLEVRDGRVLRAWKGGGPFVECGAWKLAASLPYLMSRKVDEYRALPGVQAAIEAGVPVGVLERGEWIHLGGDEPSVEGNLRAVLARLLEERATWS